VRIDLDIFGAAQLSREVATRPQERCTTPSTAEKAASDEFATRDAVDAPAKAVKQP